MNREINYDIIREIIRVSKAMESAQLVNTYEGNLSFRLINRADERRIYIAVYDLSNTTLLDCSVYYTYDDIESALRDKLHNLFYVTAQSQILPDKTESFLFDSADIYTEPSLECFLKLLDNGDIMYDIRMGAYSNGKPHDHGSGFRIRECNLVNLYKNKEHIQ